MKKLSLSLAALILAPVLDLVSVRAQALPPGVNVSLVLTSTKYLFDDPSDPIKAEITIKNGSTVPIVTSAGFSQRPFHLFLVFVDPDGKPITASEASHGVHEGGPPRIIFVNGGYLQVEEVEILPVGFVKIISIPDLRAFYDLHKAGRYTVKGVIPFRNYSTFLTVADKNYAPIDAFGFSGAVETDVIRLSLIADADGDGYAYPEPDSRISSHPAADCNDNDPAVNPGMLEFPFDNKDNDCNPLTLDTEGFVGVSIQFPPTVKLGTKSLLPLAILSTATFDATKVDPQSLTLEDAHIALNRGKGTPLASFSDVNKDGRLDLVVHVITADMTVAASDTQVVLLGRTLPSPGQPSVSIRGVATIKVIP